MRLEIQYEPWTYEDFNHLSMTFLFWDLAEKGGQDS